MELNKINSSMTNWGAEAANLNENFDKVSTAIEQVKNATIKSKGYFSSESALKLAIPTAAKGDKAYVGNNYPYQIWIWNGSSWGDSGSVGGEESVNLGNYHTKEYTDAKLSELGSEVDNKIGDSTPIVLTSKDLIKATWDGTRIVASTAYNMWVVPLYVGRQYSIEKINVSTQSVRTCSEYPSIGKTVTMNSVTQNPFTAKEGENYSLI